MEEFFDKLRAFYLDEVDHGPQEGEPYGIGYREGYADAIKYVLDWMEEELD